MGWFSERPRCGLHDRLGFLPAQTPKTKVINRRFGEMTLAKNSAAEPKALFCGAPIERSLTTAGSTKTIYG